MVWQLVLEGPSETPYAGGAWLLRLIEGLLDSSAELARIKTLVTVQVELFGGRPWVSLPLTFAEFVDSRMT